MKLVAMGAVFEIGDDHVQLEYLDGKLSVAGSCETLSEEASQDLATVLHVLGIRLPSMSLPEGRPN